MDKIKSDKKVAVIIPFYNGDIFIEKCVQSIIDNGYPHLRILVVNNSTAATTVHLILKKFSAVSIIDIEPGTGFGKANNIGADYALKHEDDILIILNQDTILDKDAIRHLISPIVQNNDIAMTGPVTYAYDFRSIESHFVQWFLVQIPELVYDAILGKLKPFYQMKEISGACFAISADFVRKFGLFDILYYMYMEDMDLCRKIRLAGKKIVINPFAKVAHAHSNTENDKNKERKIQLYKKRSTGIFVLKEPSKSVLFNFFKFYKINMEQYFQALLQFQIRQLCLFIVIDFSVILKLKKILQSRSKEKILLQ